VLFRKATKWVTLVSSLQASSYLCSSVFICGCPDVPKRKWNGKCFIKAVTQRQSIGVKSLRAVLLAALAVVIYVPASLLIREGSDPHGHIHAAIFPIAWLVLVVTAWLTARNSRRLATAAVVIATACILLYYCLPRIAS
jgi:hypothetical protein